MVDVCCGSSKLILFDIKQVVVDFNLKKKTFSFIDKNELIKSFETEIKDTTKFLGEFIIISGALYNQ